MRLSDQQWEACKARFRQAMRRQAITSRALAEGLDPPVHRNTVGRWLKPGVSESPGIMQFMQIAQILKCSGRWLLGMSEDDTPPSYLTVAQRAWLKAMDGLTPIEQQALLDAALEARALRERV